MSMIAVSSGAAARGLPVFLPTTESAADADTFVCEFTGGASANETGVGGGLSGADLVVEQIGGVGAAASGKRAIDASMGFKMTAAALQALLNGSQWTFMLLANAASVSAGKFLYYLAASAIGNYNPTLFARFINNASGLAELSATNATNYGQISNARPMTAIPLNTDVVHAAWYRDDVLHLGFLVGAYPTCWDDLPPNQRIAMRGVGNFSGCDWASTRHVVGNSPESAAFSVGRLVISKKGLTPALI